MKNLFIFESDSVLAFLYDKKYTEIKYKLLQRKVKSNVFILFFDKRNLIIDGKGINLHKVPDILKYEIEENFINVYISQDKVEII